MPAVGLRPQDVGFHPPHCPWPACPGHSDASRFRFQRAGSYRRKCDGLAVARFKCTTCGRRFSAQTFRFNYRWWRPTLHLRLFKRFIDKSSMRHMARETGAARETIARRLRVMGAHCRRWHEARLREAQGRLMGPWVFDELETFETDRRVRPVTMPVLVERWSFFVVHAEAAPLPPRGKLDARRQRRKERDERLYGKRKSGSREACERTLLKVKPLLHPGWYFDFITDRKSSYRKIIRTHFRERFASHVREYAKAARTPRNPLFTVNHTLAMLRDGVARLIRRSWCAAKLRERLDDHVWIWIVNRNYVRGITNEDPRTTPAMSSGVLGEQLRPSQILRWRDFPGREAAA